MICGVPKKCKNCFTIFQPYAPRQFYCIQCTSSYLKNWYKKRVSLGLRYKNCKCGNKIWQGSKLCKSCSAIIINKNRALSGKPYVSKRGKYHGNWKGKSVKPQTGRARAEKMYGTNPCKHCGGKCGHIHHKDINPLNNNPTNIMFLCNSCHGKEHQRLRKLRLKWKQ